MPLLGHETCDVGHTGSVTGHQSACYMKIKSQSCIFSFGKQRPQCLLSELQQNKNAHSSDSHVRCD